MREQRLPLLDADAGDLLQRRRGPRLARGARDGPGSRTGAPRRGSVAGDAAPDDPAGRFSTASRSGKDDVLLARLAFGSFRDADQPRGVQSLLRQHLRGHRDLPLAAVDDEEIRHRKLARDDPRAAARKRLAHRRVVVAARGRRHVEPPVLRRLHRVPVEDHAGGDRALAHRVRDVEALDPLRFGRQPERLLQRVEPILLRGFLRELLPDRELGILRRHRQPHAALAARIADDLHALSRLRRQHFGKHLVARPRPRDDRRRHGPLDIVLREKGRHDLGEREGVGVPRKPRAIAHVPAAADHHDVDRDQPLLRRRGDDVDVAGRRALDELPRLKLVSRVILSRMRAARSNASSALAVSICALSCASTSVVLPCRKSTALCTSSA